MHHDSFVFFRYGIESLLDYMAAESIHAQRERVAANGMGNCDDLLRGAMLKATLDKKITEAVDHQRKSLRDDGVDNLILLLHGTDLQLLLQEDGSLLIVVADNLVNNVLPVAGHVTVEQSTIVHRFGGRDIRDNGVRTRLCIVSLAHTRAQSTSPLPAHSTAWALKARH